MPSAADVTPYTIASRTTALMIRIANTPIVTTPQNIISRLSQSKVAASFVWSGAARHSRSVPDSARNR
jgi:hypothetical protein